VTINRGDSLRLAAIALVGAVVAPSLLVWGLQHAGALTGSLLLNLEAVFTVMLAAAIHREAIGARVWIAVTLMAVGGGALAADAVARETGGVLGALAVAGATLAWALDNTLTQPLSARDPFDVIGVKATAGAALATAIALIAGDAWPAAPRALALLACGTTGYGLSLRCYLLAQRRIGAARTGSVFALAPFVGAVVAWIAGERAVGVWALAAVPLFALGAVLHLTELHRHRHAHPAVAHDHAHRHDDGHHDHVHEPPVAGEHSHPHSHTPLTHEHDHVHDEHHHHDHA
jgi:drug/metabolite transporter (DMT)-like permease